MLNALNISSTQVNAVTLTHLQSYVIQETAEGERCVRVTLSPQKLAGEQIQAIPDQHLGWDGTLTQAELERLPGKGVTPCGETTNRYGQHFPKLPQKLADFLTICYTYTVGRVT